MARGDPLTSPWRWEANDNRGKAIGFQVSFVDSSTPHTITGIQLGRAAGCDYSRLLIGTGADGNPDDTDKIVVVPVGVTTLGAGALNNLANHGVSTIEDILALNITAAP